MAEDVPTTLASVKDFKDVFALDKFLQELEIPVENHDFLYKI